MDELALPRRPAVTVEPSATAAGELARRCCHDVADWLRNNDVGLPALVDETPIGIVITDTTRGFVIANQPAIEFFGQPDGFNDVSTWMDTVPAEERAAVLAFRSAVAADGEPRCLRHRLALADRSTRWVKHCLTPFRVGGEPAGFISTLTDVTVEWSAAGAPDVDEELIVGLVDNFGVLVVIVDPDGSIQKVNPTCAKVADMAADDAVGRPFIGTLVPDDARSEVDDALASLIGGAISRTITAEIPPPGERRPVSWRFSMLAGSDGGPRSFLWTGVDMTDQHLLERRLVELDRLDSIGRVAAGVAHDFGNTLTVLQLRLDRLMARPLDDEGRDDLSVMQRTIERSRELIADLVAFSRAEAAMSAPISINTEVERSLEMVAELVRDDVDVAIELTGDDPAVLLDPSRVRQVLTNLVLNAHDAMPGGGEMRVRTTIEMVGPRGARELAVTGGLYVRLSVADSGIGIEESALPLVFDPYYTTKPPSTGTGIGLATVHGIVSQAGGAITIASELGQGTTFDVWLPAQPSGEGSVSTAAAVDV
ncbi:MAG: ATP-binding protein [Ilumatobacteraceae bacterium]